MSVRMDESEVSECLGSAHTGILATLRSGGAPAIVPLWFVVVDGSVCLRTLGSSAKAKHIQDDPRVSFLVESGQAWAELRAVVIYGVAELIDSPEFRSRIDDALAEKYANFLMPGNAPSRTREHYAASRIYLRVVPTGRTLTWDNSKLRSA
jgi:PPOX class probable F420-dependent enzyme